MRDLPLALERCSSRAISKLGAWPDTGWNCLLIIRDRQAGVRCLDAASASDIGKVRRCYPILARAGEAHKAHIIERIVAASKLDWKAAPGLLECRFASEF